MKYFSQIVYIVLFSLAGELLQALIPLPIPAAIYGLVLMLIALVTGILKIEQVQETSDFLISIMPILYVPICVRVLEYWGIISENAAAIFIISIVSTVIVFGISGRITQRIMRKKHKEEQNNG